MPGKRPSLVITSLWQTPQAWTRILTCSGPGCGISRSTISKSPPAFGTCTAFIFAIFYLSLGFFFLVAFFDEPAALRRLTNSIWLLIPPDPDDRKDDWCGSARLRSGCAAVLWRNLPRRRLHAFAAS